jgi:hypothetical protein
MIQRTTHKLLFSFLCLISGIILLTAASVLGSGREFTTPRFAEVLAENANHVMCVLSVLETQVSCSSQR